MEQKSQKFVVHSFPASCLATTEQFFLLFSGCVLPKAVGVMAAYLWHKVIQNVCFTSQLAAVKSAVEELKLLNDNNLKEIRSLDYNSPYNNCQIAYKLLTILVLLLPSHYVLHFLLQ